MSCKRRYTCDLCRDEIADAQGGIGLKWSVGNKIRHVYLPDAETHLCNRCLEALREMFGEIDKTTAMYRELDAAGEASPSVASPNRMGRGE